MVNAALPLPGVPGHVRLRPEDLPFWEGIVRARARAGQADADLVVPAQLRGRGRGKVERRQAGHRAARFLFKNVQKKSFLGEEYSWR